MPLFGGSRPTGSQCLFVPLRVETKRDIYSENGVPVFVSTLFVPCLYLVLLVVVVVGVCCCCCFSGFMDTSIDLLQGLSE